MCEGAEVMETHPVLADGEKTAFLRINGGLIEKVCIQDAECA